MVEDEILQEIGVESGFYLEKLVDEPEFLANFAIDDALKVYRGQCRKSEEQRQGMRIVHQELVEKGFMKKLSDFDKDIQDFITKTAF